MEDLTRKSASLWAKKSQKGEHLWLPLALHMSDSAGVAALLWEHWLAPLTKRTIAENIEGLPEGTDALEVAKQVFVFLAAVHDLGKATPVFQGKESRIWGLGDLLDEDRDQIRLNCAKLDESLYQKIKELGLGSLGSHGFPNAIKSPHALASQLLLEELANVDKSLTCIVGAHHGKPATDGMLRSQSIASYPENYAIFGYKLQWEGTQKELIDFCLSLAHCKDVLLLGKPSILSQVLLSGLIVMVDWVVSNESYFPYIGLEDEFKSLKGSRSRVLRGWSEFRLTLQSWEATNAWQNSELFSERFDFEAPNAVQEKVNDVVRAIEKPGILVLEAPMGMGKTEAALVAAEVFAQKTGCSGVFFALPTQATSNGIFPRIKAWVASLAEASWTDDNHTLMLSHGKAQFNEDFSHLKQLDHNVMQETISAVGDEEDDTVVTHSWFAGSKKAMLADFVVGTIDQLLQAALQHKHLMLRHLGLANKVVIIDECHAYDAYMSQYLGRALEWLGAYRVPVIVLSATLPPQKRRELVEAYSGKNAVVVQRQDPRKKHLPTASEPVLPAWVTSRLYPLITYTDGYLKDAKVFQKAVELKQASQRVVLKCIDDEQLVSRLQEVVVGGGCVGIIVNTVKRSQFFAKELAKIFGSENVLLFHSRFIAPDRAQKEKQLLTELGKPQNSQRPKFRIVVGTQVLEQSLDIDFDVLFSDLCPMDLLLQRIGRLHRHKHKRPELLKRPLCYVLGAVGDEFEKASRAIYGDYLLIRTRALLPKFVDLPEDIAPLVHATYGDGETSNVDAEKLQTAYEKWEGKKKEKEQKAKTFRLDKPYKGAQLTRWLNIPLNLKNEKQGEAAVRDIEASLDVIIAQELAPNDIHFLSWIESGRALPTQSILPTDLAQRLARCTVNLPPQLCRPYIIDGLIEVLEKDNLRRVPLWHRSAWLKGELFLILDCDLRLELKIPSRNPNGHAQQFVLSYSQIEGLCLEEVERDG